MLKSGLKKYYPLNVCITLSLLFTSCVARHEIQLNSTNNNSKNVYQFIAVTKQSNFSACCNLLANYYKEKAFTLKAAKYNNQHYIIFSVSTSGFLELEELKQALISSGSVQLVTIEEAAD